MDRAIPSVNRLIMKKEQKRDQVCHKTNLKSVSKTIQNDKPTCLQFPINKKNKEQMVEGKPVTNFTFVQNDALKLKKRTKFFSLR